MDNRLDVSSLYRMGQRGGGSKTSPKVSPNIHNKYNKNIYP